MMNGLVCVEVHVYAHTRLGRESEGKVQGKHVRKWELLLLLYKGFFLSSPLF